MYDSDGTKIPKAEANQESSLKTLHDSFKVVHEDIKDYIDENEIDETLSISEIDLLISKVETLRTTYRHLFIQFPKDNMEDVFNNSYYATINNIKQYVNSARNKKKELKSKLSTSTEFANLKCNEFMIRNIKSTLRLVEAKLEADLTGATESEIKNAHKDSCNITKSMEKLSTDIKVLIRETAGTTKDPEVQLIQDRYERCSNNLRKYNATINDELSKREVDKHANFKDSLLNIKISKFGGFNSKSDIYTFQSDFEKLHAKGTPTCFLPDLLRNNYLEEPALSMVKTEQDIDEIWKRLKASFGNTKILLSHKLAEISSLEYVWKHKNPSKISESLSKVVAIMKDLLSLCKSHSIESKLYNSNGIRDVYKIIGESRATKFLETVIDEDPDDEKLWKDLIDFLEREVKIQQQKQLVHYDQHQPLTPTSQPIRPRKSGHHSSAFTDQYKCFICNATDHTPTLGPHNSKLIQYFVCKDFVEMTPAKRFATLRRLNLCHQCLFPGADVNTGKHREGRCQKDFICPHQSHDHETFPVKKHVLVCEQHKTEPKNIEMLDKFKSRCISKRTNVPDFSKSISNHHSIQSYKSEVLKDATEHSGIFTLQKILINNQSYMIFYDSGCDDFIVRNQAVKQLGTDAEHRCKLPINLGGVGDSSKSITTNVYSIKFPIWDGSTAILTGISLDKITATFPTYHLNGEVKHDIDQAYKKIGGDPSKLPQLPPTVGGDVDFMVGVRYLRYHPRFVFQLPSGLTIYESFFKNPDGSRGVIGGPHQLFTMIHQQHSRGKNDFYTNQLKIFKAGYRVNLDVPLLCTKNTLSASCFASQQESSFDVAENAGSEISYRCSKCRSCDDCKSNGSIEATSIREEIEQELINKSVVVSPEDKITVATLPFTHDPVSRLAPNRSKAMKVYQQQVSKLNKHPGDKEDVIESERKLQRLGHVDFVKNLTQSQQAKLFSNIIKNYIPWRAVWKASSITTPCRVVFDASQPTSSGYSLNSILAKGTNGMNRLVEILIRWYSHRIAFHTDVTKMYNSIKLHEDHWCFQRYLWHDTLDVNQQPEEKVIKTLIYGVKSSGNQSERGIRQTSALSKDEFPHVDEIVNNDLYVDDCISGAEDLTSAMTTADEMEISLGKGGFGLKGFTFSGSDPPESLTKDGISIGVGGLIWYPKSDEISIDVSELNFAKKQRGKKPIVHIGVVPERLTRRHCVSKVSELFDITGKITPVTASFKLDLHNLIERGLGWDDVIPDSLRPIWEDNFQMMQEIKNIKYSRTIVPPDAANLNINTVDFGDASKQMAAIAIYARIQRTNGTYSSQLIFSRSKVISPTTQPRAELAAAVLNAHTGTVVKRALKSKHENSVKLTDSTIVLHWISNDELILKPFVRNRISEIKRFTSPEEWRYINTKCMLADVATRKGAQLEDIDSGSEWINGQEWMSLNTDEFPTKTVNQIILDSIDLNHMKKETTYESNHQEVYLSYQNRSLPIEVKDRYKFSTYLLDPNKFRFRSVVRIFAYVIKYVKNLKHAMLSKRKQTSPEDVTTTPRDPEDIRLTEEELQQAESYYWRKATNEVKKFVNPQKYKHLSTEQDGILKYTGRILPDDEINITTPMTRVMKDLQSTSFCVPIVDKNSPLAYAVLHEIHWHDKTARHSGIECNLRYASKVVHILEGRDVAKRIKASCKLCRYLEKQRVKVAMGKTPNSCLTIAPAFYNTQCDLAGPFLAFSTHNKRKSIKIWLTIFCCSTTSTVSIKIMDDYSTPAFLMSFTRFSCDNGYPKNMYVDQGSQIIKGCADTKISFRDLQSRLHTDVNVNFEVCPVGGHNFNGKVERKIREVKASINKSLSNQKLSVIQWETISSEIANSVNDLPLALHGVVADFETMDLITPNRLKLGRNNDRSPAGPFTLAKRFSKIIETNQQIYDAWFDQWLINHVPKIVHQPKWFVQDRDMMVGDIVLFLRKESVLSSTYHYGMVKELFPGRDLKIRKVKVVYKNQNEKTFRETIRAVRELIVIHQVDEIDLMDELNDMYKNSK